MRCRSCNSSNTKVTVTEHKLTQTWRYCKCLDCDARYKTIEKYAVLKRGSISGVLQHKNCIKTRMKKGQDNISSVLTEKNVLDLRDMASQGKTYDEIAAKFGINKSTVYRIVNRKLWSHV